MKWWNDLDDGTKFGFQMMITIFGSIFMAGIFLTTNNYMDIHRPQPSISCPCQK